MNDMDNWIKGYKQKIDDWKADPEELQQIERTVMQTVLRPRREFRLGPVLAFAAALLIVFVSTVSWPGKPGEMLAEASQPADVESVFYMENHVAIWLDVSNGNGNDHGGEIQ